MSVLDLAYKIDGLGKQLLAERGESIPWNRDREYGHFLRRYRSSDGIALEHTGPEHVPTNGWSCCFFVKLNGRLLTRQIDTRPAEMCLGGDIAVYENVLTRLEQLAEESRLERLREQAGVTT